MDEKLEEAKKLFFDYCCNHFYMAHDGADGEYKKLGGTEELEDVWRQEYVADWIDKLSLDNLEAVDKLHHAYAIEALPDLIRMCEQAEGYARLWYANAIWHLANSTGVGDELRQQGINTSIDAWKSLEQGTFMIPEHFEKKIKQYMRPMDGTPEGYIINYAKSNLESARKRGFS